MNILAGMSAGVWWPIAAAITGLLAGSVANRCIDRLPGGEALFAGWWNCSSCRAQRPLAQAVPVVGWWAQEGRCGTCRSPISMRVPLVEILNGLLWLLLSLLGAPSPTTAVLMLLVTSLLVLSLIDLRHYILPDVITLPGVVIGVAVTLLPGWPVTLLDAALSAAVGYFAMMTLAKAAEMYYREEALGRGDWKMVAMLGAFLGSTKVITTVLIANAAGAVVGLLLVAVLGDAGRQKLPLGTFLGAAGIMVLFI